MTVDTRIVDLFKNKNKPFNLQQACDHLAQFGLGKTQIQKSLDILVASGEHVRLKEFGKTKLYIPVQSESDILTNEELNELKQEVEKLTKNLNSGKAELKQLQQELKQWTNSKTELELQEDISKFQKQLDEGQAKLNSYEDEGQLVTDEERQQVEMRFLAMMEAWRKRKGMFRRLWDTVMENVDGTDAELYDRVGIEPDEVQYRDMEQLMPKRRK